jgi:hypothetical protein
VNDREIAPYHRIAELERENAALRAYLKTGDMPDPQWSKDDIVHMYNLAMDERDAANESLTALHRENALQGLHLATMADVVLGEDAKDRSDETLVREVCRIAREHALRKEQP